MGHGLRSQTLLDTRKEGAVQRTRDKSRKNKEIRDKQARTRNKRNNRMNEQDNMHDSIRRAIIVDRECKAPIVIVHVAACTSSCFCFCFIFTFSSCSWLCALFFYSFFFSFFYLLILHYYRGSLTPPMPCHNITNRLLPRQPLRSSNCHLQGLHGLHWVSFLFLE